MKRPACASIRDGLVLATIRYSQNLIQLDYLYSLFIWTPQSWNSIPWLTVMIRKWTPLHCKKKNHWALKKLHQFSGLCAIIAKSGSFDVKGVIFPLKKGQFGAHLCHNGSQFWCARTPHSEAKAKLFKITKYFQIKPDLDT